MVEAAILVTQSLEFEPTAEKCIFLGGILERQGCKRAAMLHFRKARELQPCGPVALEELAKALDRRQEYEESSAVWASRLRVESGDSGRQFDLRLHWMNALSLAGHLRSAAEVLRQVQAHSPRYSRNVK